MNPRPCLPRALSPDDLERIFRDAVRILAEVGVACPHAKTAAALRAYAGATPADGRLRFPPASVEAHLERRAGRRTAQAGDTPFGLSGQWNCLNYCEPVTGEIRPASEAQCVESLKLAVMLGKRRGPIPVSPGYAPPHLRALECERLALLHSEGLGGMVTATDRREIRLLGEMNRVVGRKYPLGIEGLVSPLRINPETVQAYFENRDDPNVEIHPMVGIPMAGATAPLALPAGLAQAAAESIAWDLTVYAISDGALCGLGTRLEPFDMRDANIAIGTPEWCLIRQMVAEVSERIDGYPPVGGAFRSNARRPDAQAQVQRTGSALWQALLGARVFGAVGQLCMDEVFSPAQAILDREILAYVARTVEGPSALWDDALDAVEIVREGIAEGAFLATEDTLSRFREAYRYSPVFHAKNLGAWRASGAATPEAVAWEEARKLIAAYEFERPADQRAEIERLCAEARGTLK